MSGGKGRGDESGKGIFGFNLRTLVGKEEHFSEAMRGLLPLCEQGFLTPLIGNVFPFEQIVEAHRYLQARESVGKVVVTISG